MKKTGKKSATVLDDVRSRLTRRQFAAVLEAAEQYRAAEVRFRAEQKARRKSIQRLAIECLQGVDHGSDRIVVARHLYWHVHEVNAGTIAEVLRIWRHKIPVVVGALEVPCRGCGATDETRVATSRSEQGYDWKYLCRKCGAKRRSPVGDEEEQDLWEQEAAGNA